MNIIFVTLIAFLTLSSISYCRSNFRPEIIKINASNNVDHAITVKTSFIIGGRGKPINLESRIITVYLPMMTKTNRRLSSITLYVNSPSGSLSVPLELEKVKGILNPTIAKVSFSSSISLVKKSQLEAVYSNYEDDSVDVVSSIRLESFIQKDKN